MVAVIKDLTLFGCPRLNEESGIWLLTVEVVAHRPAHIRSRSGRRGRSIAGLAALFGERVEILLTRLQRRGVFINRAFPVHAEPEYSALPRAKKPVNHPPQNAR